MTRFAVIGTNYITEWFLKAAQACPDFHLQAVYSRTRARAEAFNAAYGAPMIFDDLDALAACPEVDAVYVASPNRCHAAQAIQMLRAGKHVLVEKPAASNRQEVQAIADAAQESGRVWLEAMRPVFTPGYDIIQEHLPRLGAIRRVTAVYCQYSARYDRFKNGEVLNAFDPALSNGSMMDIGVYCVHPVVKLFGAPQRVSAHSLLLGNGFEGQGTIALQYADLQSELIYSKITNSHMPSEIQGEKGSVLIGRFNRMDDLTLCLNDGTRETLAVPPCETPMVYEIQAFLDAVAGRRDVSDCTRASLCAAEVMDEARRQIGVRFDADDQASIRRERT